MLVVLTTDPKHKSASLPNWIAHSSLGWIRCPRICAGTRSGKILSSLSKVACYIPTTISHRRVYFGCDRNISSLHVSLGSSDPYSSAIHPVPENGPSALFAGSAITRHLLECRAVLCSHCGNADSTHAPQLSHYAPDFHISYRPHHEFMGFKKNGPYTRI